MELGTEGSAGPGSPHPHPVCVTPWEQSSSRARWLWRPGVWGGWELFSVQPAGGVWGQLMFFVMMVSPQ